MQRTLGFKNNPGGAQQGRTSSRHSTTGAEFFHRYPALLPFLVRELEAALEGLEAAAAAVAAPAVHPSLYPILALLARLAPSPELPVADDNPASPAALRPIVEACGRVAKPLAVRAQAARALAPLVPASAAELARFVAAGLRTAAARRGDTNLLDGVFRQCAVLAEQTLAALPPPEVAPAARGLVRQLADPAGAAPFALEVLAGDAYCDAVRTSLAGFLAALWERLGPAGEDAVVDAFGARVHGEAAQILRSRGPEHRQRPGAAVFAKRLAKLYGLTWPSDADADPAVRARLEAALASPLYEVRAGVLKALLRRRAAGGTAAEGSRLPATARLLLRRLPEERHPKVLQRALQLLSALLPAVAADLDLAWGGEHGRAWRALAEGLGATAHPKTQDALAVCVAAVLAAAAGQPTPAARGLRDALLGGFLAFADDHSRPHVRDGARLAVVRGLCETGLLAALTRPGEDEDEGGAPNGAPDLRGHALRAWTVVLRLLQDEDAAVRDGLAAGVSPLLAGPGPAGGAGLQTAGLQTAVLLGRAFDFLAARFADLPGTARFLRAALAGGPAGEGGGAPDGAGPGRADRRLFAKEVDNNFAEPLLVCQLSLRALARADPAAFAPAPVAAWAVAAAEALAALEARLAAMAADRNERGGWLGHPTEGPEVFGAVFQLLAAVLALARLVPAGGPGGAALRARGRACAERLGAGAGAGYPATARVHPLLRNCAEEVLREMDAVEGRVREGGAAVAGGGGGFGDRGFMFLVVDDGATADW